MQGGPFASQGVDGRRVDERRGGGVLWVEGRDPSLPEVLEDPAGRFRGLRKYGPAERHGYRSNPLH